MSPYKLEVAFRLEVANAGEELLPIDCEAFVNEDSFWNLGVGYRRSNFLVD